MADPIKLNTLRLTLRQWIMSDWSVFARLNADPVVMKYFPAILTETESHAMADKIYALIEERGWGLWAVEKKDNNQFIGFVGLHETLHELPFSPCVEIGWRLAREYWGLGYATEAAKCALDYAFTQLDLREIVSFTSVLNQPSINVMQRLGMKNTGHYFSHPKLPADSRLQKHCLYRLLREEWLAVDV